MQNQSEVKSNYSPLSIFCPFVLITLVVSAGIELLPLYLLFLLFVIAVYNYIFMAPAGAFQKYELSSTQISAMNILSKRKIVVTITSETNLYIYKSFLPNLVISNSIILNRKNAKNQFRSGSAIIIPLYGDSKILSNLRKRADKLK